MSALPRARPPAALHRRPAARTQDLATLLAVARSLATTLELHPLLQIIVAQLRTVTDYAGSAILLERGDALEVVSNQRGHDQAGDELVGVRLPLARAGTLWTRHYSSPVPTRNSKQP